MEKDLAGQEFEQSVADLALALRGMLNTGHTVEEVLDWALQRLPPELVEALRQHISGLPESVQQSEQSQSE